MGGSSITGAKYSLGNPDLLVMKRSPKTLFGRDFTSCEINIGGGVVHAVTGGRGPPLLFLHGYPQTSAMWHRVAPTLALNFSVICPDLRGYGDSFKPSSDPSHVNYSKRVMAHDAVELMSALGYDRFQVAGHDRGARVTHRLILDYPRKIIRAAVMDIAPTLHMYGTADKAFASAYYHWFFLIQPDGLPERLIGANPEFYLETKIGKWGNSRDAFTENAMAEYHRCFKNPETIRATCEDYRAAATIDLEHDESDRARKIECPLLVLWGDQGFVHHQYDVLAVWREYAEQVEGRALNCGHFLAEESPDEVIAEFQRFFLVDLPN